MKCAVVLVFLVAVCSSLEFEKRITPDGTLEINWPGGYLTYWNSILAKHLQEKFAASRYPVESGQKWSYPERKTYQYPQDVNSERKSYYSANLESYQSPYNQDPEWNRYSTEHHLSESWPLWNNVGKVNNGEFDTQKYAKKGNDVENSENQLKKTLKDENEKIVPTTLQHDNQDIKEKFWTPVHHDFPYDHDYSYKQHQKVGQPDQYYKTYPYQEHVSTRYASEYPYPQNQDSFDTEMNRWWFQPRLQEYYGNYEYHYGYPYEHYNYY